MPSCARSLCGESPLPKHTPDSVPTMPEDFTGKVALVTGSGGGIGLSTATAFARAPYTTSKHTGIDLTRGAAHWQGKALKEYCGKFAAIIPSRNIAAKSAENNPTILADI